MGFALSPMQLHSSSFPSGGAIADRHVKDGGNASPHLSWIDAPSEAMSFAVICHDPDAPLISPGHYGFVHWVLYNIPGDTAELAEGSGVGTPGSNDFGEQGWGGPQPPPGHGSHHYYFWLLALDREMQLEAGLNMWDFLARVEPHVIAANRLVGTYRSD